MKTASATGLPVWRLPVQPGYRYEDCQCYRATGMKTASATGLPVWRLPVQPGYRYEDCQCNRATGTVTLLRPGIVNCAKPLYFHDVSVLLRKFNFSAKVRYYSSKYNCVLWWLQVSDWQKCENLCRFFPNTAEIFYKIPGLELYAWNNTCTTIPHTPVSKRSSNLIELF
jgi:hypothetical protein